MQNVRVVGLKAVDAQDRSVWKEGIMRRPSDLCNRSDGKRGTDVKR